MGVYTGGVEGTCSMIPFNKAMDRFEMQAGGQTQGGELDWLRSWRPPGALVSFHMSPPPADVTCVASARQAKAVRQWPTALQQGRRVSRAPQNIHICHFKHDQKEPTFG